MPIVLALGPIVSAVVAATATVAVGKVIYDAIADEDEPSLQKKSNLELNIERLRIQLKSHTGRKIAIIGQPGAGKSSLLKKMTNGKVMPLPIIGAQTDATTWADNQECNLLSRYENYAFADVPGYDTLSHPVHIFSSFFPFNNFDAFVFVIHGKLHAADEVIFQLAAHSGKKICIARSFSDGLENNEKRSIEDDIRMRLSPKTTIPISFFSNRTGDGIKNIFDFIR